MIIVTLTYRAGRERRVVGVTDGGGVRESGGGEEDEGK